MEFFSDFLYLDAFSSEQIYRLTNTWRLPATLEYLVYADKTITILKQHCYFYRTDTSAQKRNNQNSFRYGRRNNYMKFIQGILHGGSGENLTDLFTLLSERPCLGRFFYVFLNTSLGLHGFLL